MTDEMIDKLLERHAHLTPASADVERAMIEARLRIDRKGYFADEGQQRRYRDLLSQKCRPRGDA